MPIIQNFPVFYSINKKGVLKPQAYGFTYLSEEVCSMMRNLIELYDNCEVLTMDTALSTKQEHAEKVQEAVTLAQATGNLTKLHSLIRDDTQALTAANSFHWYKAWNQSLQKEQTWQQMNAAIDNSSLVQKKQFEVLRVNWKRHGKFSHFSLETLLYAAHILDLMEEYLQRAVMEFKSRSRKMTSLHQNEYSAYLTQSLKAIAQEKQFLMAAMLVRLQLMRETRDLTYTDITVHTLKQLKALGGLRPDTSLERQQPSTPFNAKLFLQCHRYINKQGGTAKLRQLFHIEQPNKTIPLIGKSCATHYILVPAQLASYVPTKPAKVSKLSKGHQLRYHFFKDKTALLLSLSFLAGATVKVTNRLYLLENPFWHTLKQAQQQVDEALKAAQKLQVTGWRARFYRETNDFLAKWQATLYEQQQMIIQHYLTFLEEWAAIPPAAHLFKKPVFSPSVQQEIKEALHYLESVVSVTHVKYPQLKAVKQMITTLLQTDSQYQELKEKALKTLEQLAHGNTVTSEELMQLLDYYAELNPEEQKLFEETHQDNFNIIRQFISSMLSKTPTTIIHLENYSAKLLLMSQCGQLLRQSKQLGLQERFSKMISQMITNYMDSMKQANQQLTHADTQEQLIAYEAVLEKLATAEQIDRLVAAQIFRQTAKSSNARNARTDMALPTGVQTVQSLPGVISTASILKEHQAFKERSLQNQQCSQELQQYLLQADEITIDIEETLDRCEESKKQCAQLLLQNDRRLQTFTLEQADKAMRVSQNTHIVEALPEVVLDTPSQLPQYVLKK